VARVFQRYVQVSLWEYVRDESAIPSWIGFSRNFCCHIVQQKPFLGVVLVAFGMLAATSAGQCVSLALIMNCVGGGGDFVVGDGRDGMTISLPCQSSCRSGLVRLKETLRGVLGVIWKVPETSRRRGDEDWLEFDDVPM
jgi:hypothetical protein